MPVADMTVVQQRYDAVREVLEGAKIKHVALSYRVDRKTLYRWLVRYANEGLGALANKSSKPQRCPHQISPEIEVRIIDIRRAHPAWGPRTILSTLRKELDRPPSRASIYRCLVRHRLIDPKPRRRRAAGLQAMGALAIDGALADGHRRWSQAQRRHSVVSSDRDR